jgi:hypothetical protein
MKSPSVIPEGFFVNLKGAKNPIHEIQRKLDIAKYLG